MLFRNAKSMLLLLIVVSIMTLPVMADEGLLMVINGLPYGASEEIAITLGKVFGLNQDCLTLEVFPYSSYSYHYVFDRKYNKSNWRSYTVTSAHPNAQNIDFLSILVTKQIVVMEDKTAALLRFQDNKYKKLQANEIEAYFTYPSIPDEYLSWSHKEKLAWNTKNIYPAFLTWVDEWEKYIALDSKKVDVLVIKEQEYRQHPLRVIQDVAKFYNIKSHLSKDELTKVLAQVQNENL